MLRTLCSGLAPLDTDISLAAAEGPIAPEALGADAKRGPRRGFPDCLQSHGLLLAIVSSLRYIAVVSKSKQQEAEGATGLSEESDNEVGDFIREQRERANLSLRRLAERAGVSNPYLSQIERGIRNPSAEILKRLSRALEISAETLYTRAGLIEDGPAAPTVVEAIESDRNLTPRQKQVVLDLYRALVEAGAAADEASE